MTGGEVLNVFLAMLNSGFRAFIDVITRLKELFFQLAKHRDIALIGLAQNAQHKPLGNIQ
jgi:hypothetical protein